jgi:hypothetical protein
MKKIFITAALMIINLSVLAQRGNLQNMSVEERAQFQTTRMTKFLELDSSVIDKVHEINLKYAKQLETGRTENTSRYEMMKLMEKTNNSKNKEMKKVLTKHQYKKYMRAQQEMRNRIQERMRSEDRMGAGGNEQQ